MIRWLICIIRYKHHDPKRHPLGGFRCSRCFIAIANIGYVSIFRTQYNRRETTRSWGYE